MNFPKLHTFNCQVNQNNVYKNKTACYELSNCIIDLREFGKHPEYEQTKNIKVYSERCRVQKYINRNPETNAVWYSELDPTYVIEENAYPKIDPSRFVVDATYDELFFCYDYLEWQYSHFLTDVYPKMWYYPELKKKFPHMKFGQIRPILNFAWNLSDKTLKTKLNIVSDFAHDITDFYLKQGGFKNDFFPLESGKVYFIKKLFIPVPYTSQDVPEWPDVQLEMYDLLSEESDRSIVREFPENVFISRKDTVKHGWFNLRHCVNEDAIAKSLNEIGFESVELMPLNIFEKIKVFRSAKKIVQLVGSNCFNSVFSKPETKIYTLLHPYYLGWSPMLNSIANQRGCQYIPYDRDIEMLGTDGYPDEYKRIPDQPWKLTNIEKFVNTITENLPELINPQIPPLTVPLTSSFAGVWNDISSIDLDKIANLILTGKTALQLEGDFWMSDLLGDRDKKITVIDFGCGLGRNTFDLALRNKNWTVIGYDSPSMISKITDFSKIHYGGDIPQNVVFISDWEELKHKKIDKILCVLVLQHIYESPLRQYINDFKLMTNMLLVTGRRYNDESRKSTWKILEEEGLIPQLFMHGNINIPYVADGPEEDHNTAYYKF